MNLCSFRIQRAGNVNISGPEIRAFLLREMRGGLRKGEISIIEINMAELRADQI